MLKVSEILLVEQPLELRLLLENLVLEKDMLEDDVLSLLVEDLLVDILLIVVKGEVQEEAVEDIQVAEAPLSLVFLH